MNSSLNSGEAPSQAATRRGRSSVPIAPAVALLERLLGRLEGTLLALPDAGEAREIFRAAALEVAERESQWLIAKQAAAHCGWSLRSFQRKRDELGIPYSEIDGLQRYYRADLDAVLAAHLVCPAGPQVIAFPSLSLRHQSAA